VNGKDCVQRVNKRVPAKLNICHWKCFLQVRVALLEILCLRQCSYFPVDTVVSIQSQYVIYKLPYISALLVIIKNTQFLYLPFLFASPPCTGHCLHMWVHIQNLAASFQVNVFVYALILTVIWHIQFLHLPLSCLIVLHIRVAFFEDIQHHTNITFNKCHNAYYTWNDIFTLLSHNFQSFTLNSLISEIVIVNRL
jgi:hypothetical protein